MEECLKYYPTFEEGHLALAQLLVKVRSYTEAQGCYRNAIKCDPKHSLAYKQLAQLFITLKQHQKAVELLTKNIERFKGDT